MSEPIRILYEIHPHTLGGTERFLARFVGLLDRRRYEPVVISQKLGLPLQAIHSLGVRTETIKDYFRALGIEKIADFIRLNDIKLVQSNYYSSQLAMAAGLAGVPHVWRLGGHVDVGSGVRNQRDAALALNIIRLLSKEVVCNSRYVRSQFRGGFKSPPVRVILNGIQLTPAAPRLRAKRRLSVGMIAHFTPQKRHVDFIRAAEIISERREEVSFSIFGSTYANAASRSYAMKVAHHARNLVTRGVLTISEFFDSRDEALSGLDIVVLPSVRESFSNAILEAMAAGVPAIAARSGGNGELVRHQKTGLLVPPKQPAALAEAITRLIDDPAFVLRMGRAARERARSHFSLEECVNSYEAVYSRVLSGGSK